MLGFVSLVLCIFSTALLNVLHMPPSHVLSSSENKNVFKVWENKSLSIGQKARQDGV